ncbi:MAG: DUF4465 domain-containing protein [Planctomycetota bacterium]
MAICYGKRRVNRSRIIVALLLGNVAVNAATVDFEEFGQPPYSLGPESYWNGSDGSGGFTSQGAFFNNLYTDWGGGFYAWSGWSVSNITDNTTPGYDNQYSAYPGGGADGSEFYSLSYTFNPGDAHIELPAGAELEHLLVTNTTYAALSMLDGDFVSKKFGGDSGNDPDWFKLTITGLDENEVEIGCVNFYLADYRFDDNQLDYIVDEWTLVDLSSLSTARKLSFGLDSSDVHPVWGMNTPAYFAMDNLVFVPEPATAALLICCALFLRRRM